MRGISCLLPLNVQIAICVKVFANLNKWIPQLVYLLIKVAEGRDFYKATAYLTEGFIEMDYGFIKGGFNHQVQKVTHDAS